MQKIKPFLWFDRQAEEAVQFYVSTFGNSSIGTTTRYSEAASAASGQPEGSVMTVTFKLDGLEFVALNGGPLFKFSPAISFFVHCKSEQELDSLWKKLSADGKVLMPLDKYPFAEKYGWTEDRFGLSWQLILNENPQRIVPCLLFVGNKAGKAEEAMNFYISQFKDSGVVMVERYGPGEGSPENAIKYAKFSLAGEEFVTMESYGDHKFDFTPAISLLVDCESQKEVDGFWKSLTEGGQEGQCGWLQDKYGISWQIAPKALGDLMSKGTPEQAKRVMNALLKMKKLDIGQLEEAFKHHQPA